MSAYERSYVFCSFVLNTFERSTLTVFALERLKPKIFLALSCVWKDGWFYAFLPPPLPLPYPLPRSSIEQEDSKGQGSKGGVEATM